MRVRGAVLLALLASGCGASKSVSPESAPSLSQRTQPAAEVTRPPEPELEEPDPDELLSVNDAPEVSASAQRSTPSDSSPNTKGNTRPWLGADIFQQPQGVVVERVLPGSPAASAGVKAGDVLVNLAGRGITKPTDLHLLLAEQPVGERLSLSVRRAGQLRLLPLVLTEKPKSQELMQQLFVGRKAPPLHALKSVSGRVAANWRELSGKVVVLEFWASWCVACRAVTPSLNRWQERMGVQGVRVLGITTDPFEEAERAAHALNLNYAVFADPSGDMTQAYRALALPSVFVIDKHGQVRDVMVGFEPKKLRELGQLVERLALE